MGLPHLSKVNNNKENWNARSAIKDQEILWKGLHVKKGSHKIGESHTNNEREREKREGVERLK